MSNGNGMKFTEVMPGAIIAHANPDVMAGCPSEIVKVLKLKGISMPTTIIMPTLFYAKGLLQAACEFPLYAFLFVLGLFFKGKKLTIIGEADQCERMRNILRLTLLGPTREEMAAWGIEEKEISQILRLNQHFALKKPGTQEVAQIDDLVKFIAFHNDMAVYDGQRTIIVEKKGTNLFTVNNGEAEVAVDINVHKLQSPPIPILPKGLAQRAIFGAVALTKCTTGFDHTGYTTALGVMLNYMMLLVDGAPWEKEHLRSLGINHSQVCGHIVSHIHDDHSNIYDLIVNGQKFVLLSDKLGYHMLVKKTALTLDLSEEQVAGLIELVEAEKGVPLNFYGAEFLFWRTVHPNATLGFSVTMNGKTIVFSGDTLWGKDLDALVASGVVDADVAELVQKAPRRASEVTFMDCGGGQIHPKMQEVAKTLSEQELSRIVPTHIMNVPEEFAGRFEVIEPGQQWIITPGRTCETGDMLQVVDAPIFEGMSPAWRNTIFAHGETRLYRPGETVLKLGQTNDRLYVVIGGSVSVKNESGETLARLAAGDFFGEISIMRGVPVTATVETDAETKLFSLPGQIFLNMATATGLFERLAKVHAVRPVMMKFGFTRDLPSRVMNELIQAAELRCFEEGETVIAEGDTNVDRLYGILHGQASVHFRGRAEVISLYQHDVFGEMAFINKAPRIATVKAAKRLQVFSLSRVDFDRIVAKTPMLYVYLGLLTKERGPTKSA